jgi:hypothetical protein
VIARATSTPARLTRRSSTSRLICASRARSAAEYKRRLPLDRDGERRPWRSYLRSVLACIPTRRAATLIVYSKGE